MRYPNEVNEWDEAKNVNTPSEDLVNMARNSKEQWTLAALANNPNLPQEAIDILIEREHYSLITHKNCSLKRLNEFVEEYKQKNTVSIVFMCLKHPFIPADTIGGIIEWAEPKLQLLTALSNVVLNEAHFDALYDKYVGKIPLLKQLATHPNISNSVAGKLIELNDDNIFKALASNAFLQQERYVEIIGIKATSALVAAMVKNPNISMHSFHFILDEVTGDDGRQTINNAVYNDLKSVIDELTKYVAQKNLDASLEAAKDKNTSVDRLLVLTKMDFPIAMSAYLNPKFSQVRSEALSHEANQEILAAMAGRNDMKLLEYATVYKNGNRTVKELIMQNSMPMQLLLKRYTQRSVGELLENMAFSGFSQPDSDCVAIKESLKGIFLE